MFDITPQVALKGTPAYTLSFERGGQPFGDPIAGTGLSGSVAFPTDGDGSVAGYVDDGWDEEAGLLLPTNDIVGPSGVSVTVELVDQGDGDATYTSGAVEIVYSDEDECVAGLPPQSLSVEALSTVCIADAPWVEYDIETQGFSWPGSGTLTFTHATVTDFEEVVPITEPSGEVVYPGAEVDAQGNAIDWPGWTQNEDGFWVEDESDAFLREGLIVTVEVNPTASDFVTYPDASEVCAGPPAIQQQPPPGPAPEAPLPATGMSGFETSLRIGALLMIGGLGFVIVARRRRFAATTASA